MNSAKPFSEESDLEAKTNKRTNKQRDISSAGWKVQLERLDGSVVS